MHNVYTGIRFWAQVFGISDSGTIYQPYSTIMDKLIFLIGITLGAISLSVHLPTTASFSSEESTFNIEDYSWLAGSWTGDGFGGISEETWSSPINGTMMGMYRHINNGELIFYEFLLLNENGIRLKHFNPDLTGWEEKDDMTTFEMISFSKTKIEMKGLTIEKKSDDEIEIRLRMTENGEAYTEVFKMRRVE